MTHAELVENAARWLRGRCPVVITEMSSGSFETPDAIGFKGEWSTLVECKTSRSDFAADRKKWFRARGLGMGYRRYFCAPKGLIAPDELPEGWGLLEAHKSGRVVCAVKSGDFPERASNREVSVLVSALRRIGGAIPEGSGVSVKYYTYTTGNTASLGVDPDPADSGAIAPWEPDDVTVYGGR